MAEKYKRFPEISKLFTNCQSGCLCRKDDSSKLDGPAAYFVSC